jgi:hypothetical protein
LIFQHKRSRPSEVPSVSALTTGGMWDTERAGFFLGLATIPLPRVICARWPGTGKGLRLITCDQV